MNGTNDKPLMHDPARWDTQTGYYVPPSLTWKIDAVDIAGSTDTPDVWLSKPGGEYRLAASFHFPGFNFPSGTGRLPTGIAYTPSPFVLNHVQDPYNSWNVRASTMRGNGPMEHWDWLPGIMLVDETTTYSLPSDELSAFAGTEWADNDARVFHGLHDDAKHAEHLDAFLQAVNAITGPGWANWPFGHRQLDDAVMCWLRPGAALPDVVLLLSVRQSGVKFSYRRKGLYDPGGKLGAWLQMPPKWDCRQAMKFLYQASLLAKDGLAELAVVSAIAALENASAEILLYLSGGNTAVVQSALGKCKFLSRFDKVLPKHGATLPPHKFAAMKAAYLARNGVAHALAPVSQEAALHHVRAVEDVLVWYLANI
ncbi:MAG TPA: hypothetical protein VN950_28945 [Terriglobales bacterium]|nr:hypothetical protein [Terriglobales bacterium]